MRRQFNAPPKPNLSKTSIQRFDECERKWALHYGHSFLTGSFAQAIDRESDLMPWQVLVGQVVDDVITEALRHFADTQDWIPDPFDRAVRTIGEYVRRSKRHAAGTVPDDAARRRQPIDRYYYGQEVTTEEKSKVLEDVGRFVAHFWNSPTRQYLETVPRAAWRLSPPGETPWFLFEDEIPVYASYDFALHTPEQTMIFDWKCGKLNDQSEAAALDQLHGYALYAMSDWGAKKENIVLCASWVSAGPLAYHTLGVPVSDDILERLTDTWRDRYATLKQRYAIFSKTPKRLLELFPMTTDATRCVRCTIHSCEGYLAAMCADSQTS